MYISFRSFIEHIELRERLYQLNLEGHFHHHHHHHECYKYCYYYVKDVCLSRKRKSTEGL